jgi:hypothetical protein
MYSLGRVSVTSDTWLFDGIDIYILILVLVIGPCQLQRPGKETSVDHFGV